MNLVKIHIIRPQASQAVVNRMHNVLAREPLLVRIVAHWIEDLGRNHQPVPRRAEILEYLPNHFFASANGVHIGGVEKVDTQFHSSLKERTALLQFQYPLA